MNNFIVNKSIFDVAVSPTLAINERCKQLKSEGKEIIHFGFGQSPFPVPDILVEELKTYAHLKNYEQVQGLLELREAIQAYYERRNLVFDKDQIFIGSGTKPLLNLIQFVLDIPLILPIPSWVSYQPQAKLLKKSVYNIDCSADKKKLLKAEQLDKYCTKHELSNCLLLLNYPSNPLGTSYNDKELEDLAEISRKYNLIVISDEIYGDLNFNSEHISIAKHYPEGSIITNGLSKWGGAGGWRIGALMIPYEMKKLAEALRIVISETYSCVSSPIQKASVLAFQEPEAIIKYKNTCKQILKRISKYVHVRLSKYDPELAEIVGGFYCFPTFDRLADQFISRGIQNDKDLCEYLLNEIGVALLPGSAFGVDNHFSVRLSFVDFDGQFALNHFERSIDLNEEETTLKLAPNVYHGVNKLTDWLDSI